jgi:ribokinase
MSSNSQHPSDQLFVVGSVNQDLVFTTDRLPLPGETLLAKKFKQFAGGKGANQAVAAARQGANVCFVGAVGDDLFGSALRDQFVAQGIDTKQLRTIANCATGTACIVVDQAGQNSIVVALGANARINAEQVTHALAQAHSASLLLMPLEIPIDVVEIALKAARKKGLLTLLNPSPVDPLLGRLHLLADVDLLILNQHEAARLCGFEIDTLLPETLSNAASHLLGLGCKDALITLGSQGVFYQSEIFGAPAAKVVDTTGAGDCFAGSLAAAMLRNGVNRLGTIDRINAMKQCIDQAQLAAAISVGFEGAQTGMPRRGS